MTSLKSSLLITMIFLYGCSNTSFKVHTDSEGGSEVIAPSDRFLPFCEKVKKDDGIVAYGFMILFLDEQKTVGTATGMLTTKKACQNWESITHEVLTTGETTFLAGFGDLNKPRVMKRFFHTFKGHGTFYDNGRSMDFFSVRNNRGKCFSVDPERCK